MNNNNKYLTLDEVAAIINPNHSSCAYNLVWFHIKKGHITPIYPEMQMKHEGEVITVKKKKPALKDAFFLRSEAEKYTAAKKINKTRGAQKKVKVTHKGQEQTFASITEAATFAEIVYYRVYWALTHDKEIEGYKFKYLKNPL
jgi:hypothetical protein